MDTPEVTPDARDMKACRRLLGVPLTRARDVCEELYEEQPVSGCQDWVPQEAAERAAERMDEPGSPGRPARERPTCGLCEYTIRFKRQQESSPFGTVHRGCAEHHREQHPDQW